MLCDVVLSLSYGSVERDETGDSQMRCMKCRWNEFWADVVSNAKIVNNADAGGRRYPQNEDDLTL